MKPLTLITVIDDLAEARDLATVALMAVSDLGDRAASSGLTRLIGLICTQMDGVAEKLNAEQRGQADDQQG